MTNESPYTQREIRALSEAVNSLRKAIDELPGKIDGTYLRKDNAELRFKGIEEDIAKHSDWITWALRLIVGFIVVTGLGAVITLAAQQGVIGG
jgi:hypothetical protein